MDAGQLVDIVPGIDPSGVLVLGYDDLQRTSDCV